MPDMESNDLHQKAVLYSVSGRDRYNNPTRDAAVEISVRWEDGKREVLDSQGNTIASDARIVVDRQLSPGDLLWKGKLDDLPSPVTDLKQVVDYSEVPDVKSRATRRTALLMAYGDELPSAT